MIHSYDLFENKVYVKKLDLNEIYKSFTVSVLEL